MPTLNVRLAAILVAVFVFAPVEISASDGPGRIGWATTVIKAAGFGVESCERFLFTPGAPIPPIPHILGVARRR